MGTRGITRTGGRQLSEQERAAQQLRALAKPHRFRVQAVRVKWFDGRALAVYCDHPKLLRELWAIANVRQHQTSDRAMRAVFPPEALEQVAAVIRARRKPRYRIGRGRLSGHVPATGGAFRVENGSRAWRRG